MYQLVFMNTCQNFTALSTQLVFRGKQPWEFDPGLINSRQKSKIIAQKKAEKMPDGTGFTGTSLMDSVTLSLY